MQWTVSMLTTVVQRPMVNLSKITIDSSCSAVVCWVTLVVNVSLNSVGVAAYGDFVIAINLSHCSDMWVPLIGYVSLFICLYIGPWWPNHMAINPYSSAMSLWVNRLAMSRCLLFVQRPIMTCLRTGNLTLLCSSLYIPLWVMSHCMLYLLWPLVIVSHTAISHAAPRWFKKWRLLWNIFRVLCAQWPLVSCLHTVINPTSL